MTPLEAVAQYVSQQPDVSTYCVAYSGGMDSHVLLWSMSYIQRSDSAIEIRAIHVDHGLHSDSARWAEHATRVCGELNIPLTVLNAQVIAAGDGPEAGARLARYAQFSDNLQENEQLLLAQHAEDQAETFLLQALRGSGTDGLAGIPRKRRFSVGFMVRPLLGCSRESLRELACEQSLEWIEDPSNQDTQLDRNYLRLKVMPMLKHRWPASAQTLSRSAFRSAAASQTLMALGEQDLLSVRVPGAGELSLTALAALPRERAFVVLRLMVRERGWRMPRLQDLLQVMSDLVKARHDSNGIVNVRDYVFRRHKDNLYLMKEVERGRAYEIEWISPFAPLTVTEAGVTLTSAAAEHQGIRLPEGANVIVKSRVGGELIKLGEPAFHKAVKKLLQETDIPPWVRDTIPLIYIDGSLAAVWGVAVAVDCRLPVASALAQDHRPTAIDTS